MKDIPLQMHGSNGCPLTYGRPPLTTNQFLSKAWTFTGDISFEQLDHIEEVFKAALLCDDADIGQSWVCSPRTNCTIAIFDMTVCENIVSLIAALAATHLFFWRVVGAKTIKLHPHNLRRTTHAG